MIDIDRRTLFDIIDEYGRASSSSANTNRNVYRTYNPYLRPAQWATTQWAAAQTATNNTNGATANADTESYTLNAEMLYHHFNIPLEPDTVSVIIDDCLPQKEITEDELMDFLNGKDDTDANK